MKTMQSNAVALAAALALGLLPGCASDLCRSGMADICTMQAAGFRSGTPRRAAQYYALACRMGDPEGCANLGEMYATGDGVPPSPGNAVHHLRVACDGASIDGCFTLAEVLRVTGGDRDEIARVERRASRLEATAARRRAANAERDRMIIAALGAFQDGMEEGRAAEDERRRLELEAERETRERVAAELEARVAREREEREAAERERAERAAAEREAREEREARARLEAERAERMAREGTAEERAAAPDGSAERVDPLDSSSVPTTDHAVCHGRGGEPAVSIQTRPASLPGDRCGEWVASPSCPGIDLMVCEYESGGSGYYRLRSRYAAPVHVFFELSFVSAPGFRGGVVLDPGEDGAASSCYACAETNGGLRSWSLTGVHFEGEPGF